MPETAYTVPVGLPRTFYLLLIYPPTYSFLFSVSVTGRPFFKVRTNDWPLVHLRSLGSAFALPLSPLSVRAREGSENEGTEFQRAAGGGVDWRCYRVTDHCNFNLGRPLGETTSRFRLHSRGRPEEENGLNGKRCTLGEESVHSM